MKLLRRLMVLVLQFAIVTAMVVIGCIAWTLNDRGISYAETGAFKADLVLWTQAGMVAAGIVCLVLLCYRLTAAALDGPDEPWRY